MNNKEIQQLIKFVSKSGVNEVKIESKDFKISIKTGSTPKVVQSEPLMISRQPISQAPVAPVIESQSNTEDTTTNQDDNLITIKSLIIGTF